MKRKFWKSKKVAVTGANGFLGKHFVGELKRLGAIVKPLRQTKCNLLSLKQTTKALKDIDIVINCAALDGNAEFKLQNAARIMDSNIKIVSNILNASKKNKIKDIVLISSVEIYSPLAPSPIKEEDDFQKYDGYTTNGYVLSKRFSEILSELYAKEFNLRIYLPRPTNIYGPGDHFGKTAGRVIPNFIKKLSAGEKVEIWGDGSQIRQFVYVSDVVKTVLKMVETKYIGKLNIATNGAISILNLAKTIRQKLNSQSDITLCLPKNTGVHNRILDTSKMDRLTDFTPVDLATGIQKTIDWYLKNTKN